MDCGRRKNYYKPKDLVAALEDLWQRGERSGKKIKPAAAWVRALAAPLHKV